MARSAVVVAVVIALYWLYLRQARTIWVTSDGASNALQAWDMLHGNPLLRGWWLSDVTFYTTELPEYMLIEMARGLSASVIWTGAAITYTLLVVGTALLAYAPGGTTPLPAPRFRGGIQRALLAAGIVLAPSSVLGTPMLLSSPDHIGTSVPLLAALLLIDRGTAAGAARRWWLVPVTGGLVLAWVQVADQVALFAGAVPVAVVCGARWVRGRERVDLALAVAAVASVPAALGALRIIAALGGFYVSPVTAGGAGLLAPLSQLPYHARMLGESILVIFGANYFDQTSATLRAIAFAHLVGLAVALAALLAGVWLLLAGRLDRVSAILVTAIAVMLIAGLLGTHLSDILAAHEVAVVAPFGAALAGRVLGEALVLAAAGTTARRRRGGIPWLLVLRRLAGLLRGGQPARRRLAGHAPHGQWGGRLLAGRRHDLGQRRQGDRRPGFADQWWHLPVGSRGRLVRAYRPLRPQPAGSHARDQPSPGPCAVWPPGARLPRRWLGHPGLARRRAGRRPRRHPGHAVIRHGDSWGTRTHVRPLRFLLVCVRFTFRSPPRPGSVRGDV